MKFWILILIVNFFIINCYSQTNSDTIYIELNRNSEYLKYRISEDSINCSFSILYDRYKTKKQRDNILKTLSPGETYSFSANFVSLRKPNIKVLPKERIYSVEAISKETVKLKRMVGFVQELEENKYLVFWAFLIVDE